MSAPESPAETVRRGAEKRRPRFGRGECPICSRKADLRADGKLRVHGGDPMTWCGGSGMRPKAAT